MWKNEPTRHGLSAKGIKTSEHYSKLNNILGRKLDNIGVKTGVGDIRFGDVYQLDEILKKVSIVKNHDNHPPSLFYEVRV